MTALTDILNEIKARCNTVTVPRLVAALEKAIEQRDAIYQLVCKDKDGYAEANSEVANEDIQYILEGADDSVKSKSQMKRIAVQKGRSDAE